MITSISVLGFIIVLLAICSVFSKKNIYAIVFLFLFFFSIGVLYIELNYALLGIVQILLYAGGIITLMLFSLPFNLNIQNKFDSTKTPTIFQSDWLIKSLLIASILGFSAYFITHFNMKPIDRSLSKNELSFMELIFSKYGILFEFLSIILLLVLIALSGVIRKGLKHG